MDVARCSGIDKKDLNLMGGKKIFSYEIFELFNCLLIQIIEALS